MTVVYEGKAKQMIPAEGTQMIQRFKDSATAGNGAKYAEFEGKGRLNNRISSLFFRALADNGVPSHFVEWQNDRDMLVEGLDIIPLEVVARNVAAGSLAKRVGFEEGSALPAPVVEMYYKKDELGDPLLNRSHIQMLGVATEEELATCETVALKVNGVLSGLLREVGIQLIDFKLEFGRKADGTVLLADEISPDTCRLWDIETKRKLDKDVFRRDLADLVETYTEVYDRLRKHYPQYAVGEA